MLDHWWAAPLNPIELAFAKLNALLRKAAELSTEALWCRIGNLLDRYSPKEFVNYFRHDGYPCKMTGIRS